MNCPSCDYKNPSEIRFCGKCGTQLLYDKESPPSHTDTLQTPIKELTRGTTFAKRYELIEELGKGGMGRKTTKAMAKYGAVYGAFTGGAAILAAKAIKRVKRVEWLDLGMPEAMWILDVKDFGPLTVAIDAHGNNVFETIQTKAETGKPRIYKKLGIQ